MLTPKGNIHYNKLPKLGQIGRIDMRREDSANGDEKLEKLAARRCIVISYPLCDSPLYMRRPMSLGCIQ